MTESKSIPRWIIIFGYILALLTIGFGAMFYLNSNPTVSMDPSWFAGGRNVAIFVVLLIGLLRKDAKLLFAGFLLRFIVDSGDMINQFLANALIAGLVFIPFLLVQAYGAWILWHIASDG